MAGAFARVGEQTPKLWTPQEAFAIDNGATVQDESD